MFCTFSFAFTFIFVAIWDGKWCTMLIAFDAIMVVCYSQSVHCYLPICRLFQFITANPSSLAIPVHNKHKTSIDSSNLGIFLHLDNERWWFAVLFGYCDGKCIEIQEKVENVISSGKMKQILNNLYRVMHRVINCFHKVLISIRRNPIKYPI